MLRLTTTSSLPAVTATAAVAVRSSAVAAVRLVDARSYSDGVFKKREKAFEVCSLFLFL